MRILITQQEFRLPFFPYVFDGLDRAWHDFFQGHELVPAVNDPGYPFDLAAYDCLVLSPGPDSIARNLTENRLYQLAESANKPIIGFCHGAFAINDIAGGINIRAEGHADCDHVVMMGGQIHTVNSFHTQVIDRLAPGFEALATDNHGRPEAFRHILRPIWAVIWHPERQKPSILPTDLAKFLLK